MVRSAASLSRKHHWDEEASPAHSNAPVLEKPLRVTDPRSGIRRPTLWRLPSLLVDLIRDGTSRFSPPFPISIRFVTGKLIHFLGR